MAGFQSLGRVTSFYLNSENNRRERLPYLVRLPIDVISRSRDWLYIRCTGLMSILQVCAVWAFQILYSNRENLKARIYKGRPKSNDKMLITFERTCIIILMRSLDRKFILPCTCTISPA
jgi:hypothetical protein